MNFQTLCKSIETRTAKELASAKSQEEKALILTSALYDYGNSVLRGLSALRIESGAGSSLYKNAQTAASELLIFLALPFISCCSSFKQGITVFEELGEICSDELLCRRIVIYANQIKKRWNQADPSALPINPRGAKVQPKQRQHPFATGAILVILSGVGLYHFAKVDLTSMIIPGWNQVRQPTQVPLIQDQEEGDFAPLEKQNDPLPPDADLTPEGTGAPGEFFSYTDSKGVLHLGNDPQKVPPRLRDGLSIIASPAPQSNQTPVLINGNRVLVPVTLSYRGRSARATLLLDTGASMTTISERLAAQLGVDPADTGSGTATVADGRTVGSRWFVADALAVGPKNHSRIRTSILPGSGGANYDGLLGMDFLKNLRYHVNFSRNVIEWGR
jgi:predicted aspartyl protease